MNKKAEKILNTTIKLFIRDGIKKLTMDEIAENSGVSKVTIYKHFIDKDTLYFEVSKHIFTDYINKLESVIVSGDSLIKKLYDFLDVICDFANSGQFELCRELSKYMGNIEIELELYLRTYRRTLLALIDEGIANGLIKSELDKDIIYHYIDMGVVYYQQSPEYRSKMLESNSYSQRFMQFFINNIFTDGARILTDTR